MIGTIDINVQAAKPGFPLAPVRAFVSSPSSFRIRNVPRRIGSWDITGVRPTVNYPDGTTVAADAALVGGVWVGTVPGCDTPGTSAKGFVVYADGIDENGYVVTDYVLGVGDVEILNRENAVEPGTVTFKGDPGAPGEDGATPVIGPNGNWWIGGVDTGKPARGPKGEGGGGGVQSVNNQFPDEDGNVTITAANVDMSRSEGTVEDAIRTAVEVAQLADTRIASHGTNKDNPHSVTAEQVGAYDKDTVDAALAGKLDNPSGDGNSLSFSVESMYFSNSYGANYLYYPSAVGWNPEKDAETKHNGFELFATRFWVEWYLAQEAVKATLFADADFSKACAYKIVTVGADGIMTDRAINATSAASVTVPDDYTDLIIRASVTGSLSVTVPDGVTKYGDAFPAETGEYLVTITKLATGEAFVKTLKLEVAND